MSWRQNCQEDECWKLLGKRIGLFLGPCGILPTAQVSKFFKAAVQELFLLKCFRGYSFVPSTNNWPWENKSPLNKNMHPHLTRLSSQINLLGLLHSDFDILCVFIDHFFKLGTYFKETALVVKNSHKRQAPFGTTHHADHIRTCSGSSKACVISAVGVCRQRRGGPHTPGLRCSGGRADGDMAQGQSCGAWSRITAAEPVLEMKLSGCEITRDWAWAAVEQMLTIYHLFPSVRLFWFLMQINSNTHLFVLAVWTNKYCMN